MQNNPKKYQEKITVLSQSKIEIEFELAAPEFEKFCLQAMERLSKEVKMDGFRKGKIPASLMEKMVGEAEVLGAASEDAVKSCYVDAILSNNIEAIGEPVIEIKKIARGNDFLFSAKVEVLPEIKIEDWRSTAKEINREFADKKIEVMEEEIDRELKFLANQRVKLITQNRAARKGDLLEIDFEGSLDNVVLEKATAKKQSVILGEGMFVPGFEEQLVGTKEGEVKEFKVKFPEDYRAEEFRGKEINFKTKTNLVQERQIPSIDDEFAKGIGKFGNLKELRKNLKEGVEHEKKHKKEDEQKNKLVEGLIARCDFEVPFVLVEREIETMFAELKNDLARIKLGLDDYLAQLKTSEEKLKEQWSKKEALQRVKAALILRQLAKDEQIKVYSSEIEDEANKILQYYATVGFAKENVDLRRLYESIKGTLTNEKVFRLMMSVS